MGRDGESKILFPTMKSLDGVNKKNDVNNTASEEMCIRDRAKREQ